MPVKSRSPKRRQDDAAELEAWGMTFYGGHDFFGDLCRYGFPHGSAGGEAVRKAARVAWRRLGAAYMAAWVPEKHRPLPWAYEQFGPPKGGADAR